MARRRGIFNRKSEDESTESAVEPVEEEPESQEPVEEAPVEPSEERDHTEGDIVIGLPVANGDTAERIRLAAQSAAQQAEERALDEILALEHDLERVKQEAAEQLESVEGRVGEAERRVSEAERRAEDAERRADEAEGRIGELEAAQAARDAADADAPDPLDVEHALAEAEDRGRSAAAEWLREQLDAAHDEADRRQADAVDEVRAETERRVRAEFEAKTESGPDPELERLRDEVAEARERISELEAEAAKTPRPLTPEADAAVQEALAQVHDAEARATEAKRAQADAERRSRELGQREVETRTADLTRELETLPEAEDRTRLEVDAARDAAQERFAAELRIRDEELEREREEKTRIMESSDERLRAIEERALAAAERVSAAEQELAAEAERLRKQSASELRLAEVKQEAERAVSERIDELQKALNEERKGKSKALAESDRRVQEAIERAREAEERTARSAVEVRSAASSWLQTQAEALRQEGERRAAEENDAKVAAARTAAEQEAAATRRQLEEANARAEAADRRAKEAEAASRREVAREREQRFQEVESQIGALDDRVDAVSTSSEQPPEAEVQDATDDPTSDGRGPVQPSGAVTERQGLGRRRGRFQGEAPVSAPVTVIEAAPPETDEEVGPIAQLAAEAELLAPEPTGDVADEELDAPEWLSEDAATEPEDEPEADAEGGDAPVSLSDADFDQLRALGMSVTQAKRVMRYRDEHNGFETLDELDRVTGFPRSFLDEVKPRLVP